MTDLDRLREELQDGGYDGLYCTDERCGCGLDYLVACGEPINGDEGILEICKPAYKHTCIGEDCAYPCDGYLPEREGSCYGPSKNGPKRREREPNPLDRLREEYEIRHDVDVADALIAALGDEIAELTGQNIDLEVWRASAVERAEQAEAERDEARATVEARERTIETLVRSWRMYRKRAEHAERQRDEARAEVEALRCCGNCDNWSYAHRHAGEYMLCSYDAEDRSREPSEPCGFTPSRWQRREE